MASLFPLELSIKIHVLFFGKRNPSKDNFFVNLRKTPSFNNIIYICRNKQIFFLWLLCDKYFFNLLCSLENVKLELCLDTSTSGVGLALCRDRGL